MDAHGGEVASIDRMRLSLSQDCVSYITWVAVSILFNI